MMRTLQSNILILLTGLLVGAVMVVTPAEDGQAQVQLQQDAITSGGTPGSSSTVNLDGSIGQIATTSSAAGDIQSFAGLWTSFYSTDLITDIERDDSPRKDIPEEFSLDPAYPNPFNPATRISYGLPNASHVKLTVYNMLGKQVRVLVDKHQKAGHYETIFQARGLASGIYLYRLQADHFVQERKITLLK